ncbi:response regulator transcription factor [Microbacterium sp. NPDC077184]|uniref:response regulator transcription factor n=1 Tax=Microbacterium sp. NPDC077184 TaxID=3154764 RepID=UPI0034402739
MRVLIAEDDRSVAAALVSALSRAGHSSTHVSRGSDILLHHHDVDAVMLDLGLEDMDGLDALHKLRAVSEVPVVVVTARGDERSTVLALRGGADDYLVKPVRLHELLARLDAVVRRYAPATTRDRLTLGRVELDAEAHRITVDGDEVTLTPNEFKLLWCLATKAGRAVSRATILDEVWADAYAATSRSLDVHLGQVRQKVPELTVTTIRGFGYRLEAP